MLTHLTCWLCGKEYDAGQLLNVCECGKPLRVEYDLTPETLDERARIAEA